MNRQILFGLAVVALCAFQSVHVGARTVELGYMELYNRLEPLREAVNAGESKTREYKFDIDDVSYTVTLTAKETFKTDYPGFFEDPQSHGCFRPYSTSDDIEQVSIKVTFQRPMYIHGVSSQMGLYHAVNNSNYPAQEMKIIAGDSTYTSNEDCTHYRNVPVISHNFSQAPESSEVTITVYKSGGARFAYYSVSIDCEGASSAPPSRIETLTVGQIIELEHSEPDSRLFYKFDESEVWEEYLPENGIVLSESGTHSISYKALTADLPESKAVTETFEVIEPRGVDYVIAASRPITVEGNIVEQGEGYTAISATSESSVEIRTIKLDNSNCPELAGATIGASVKATGRLTDRFDGDPALGSLSAVAIDGSDVTSLTIPAAPETEPTSSGRYYDLQGRPVNPASVTRPRVILSPGKKHLLR